jgi:hypothetical protein
MERSPREIAKAATIAAFGFHIKNVPAAALR